MSGRIAYLGPEGTFCEEALIGLVGAEAAAAEVPYPSIAACFSAVESGEVAEALVPIENALEGGVSQTLDQLMAHDGRIVIRGEVIHPIRHHLIGREGLELGDVTRVISHPHAPGQCARFLREQVPQAEVAASLSTADAVRTVMAADAAEAAIGTARAAEIYGGVILADDIADADENHTRFVLVGRDEVDATGPGAFTTSIICAIPKDRPGALLSILQEFSLRAVNLSRLESRPARTGLGRYVFFIDAEGSRARDLPLSAALDAIEQGGIAHVVALGSYKTATQP